MGCPVRQYFCGSQKFWFQRLVARHSSGKVISQQWKFSLPLEDDLGDCYVAKSQFKETIEFLHIHGVAADDWLDGWYWSCEEQGRDNFHTFDMLKGCYYTHDSYDSNGFVRFALVKLPE